MSEVIDKVHAKDFRKISILSSKDICDDLSEDSYICEILYNAIEFNLIDRKNNNVIEIFTEYDDKLVNLELF